MASIKKASSLARVRPLPYSLTMVEKGPVALANVLGLELVRQTLGDATLTASALELLTVAVEQDLIADQALAAAVLGADGE